MLRPTFAHRPALRRRIALTKQMIFSPSPTAGRKIRVYVLKASAVYQKYTKPVPEKPATSRLFNVRKKDVIRGISFMPLTMHPADKDSRQHSMAEG